MVLGDRGDAVKVEQKRLNDLGAEPPLTVDGVWGPKTQAAFEKYGSADGGSTATTPAAASTSANGSELLLPGLAQLWKNETSGEWYVVYEVPGVTLEDGTSSEALFTAWLIQDNNDLEALVGPGKTATATFTGSEQDFTDKGVIHLGDSQELLLDDLEGDPFDTWVEDLTVLAEVQPWILDKDYIKLVVQAALERVDGQVSLEEIQGTTWWEEHSQGERAWMETFNSDPATAEQRLQDNRDALQYKLAEAGVGNATETVINFMADKATMGSWSTTKLDSQLNALADPYSVDVIDDDLFEFMANEQYTPDHIKTYENSVRKYLREWLGPVFDTWTDEQVTAKAGEFRNDPDAEQAFVEGLKDQRMALFPEHKDREASYEAIAAPWRMFSQNMWGQPVDDTDDVFQDVLRANDSRTASTMLRKAGLARGYDKTTNDVISGLKSATKSNVRGAV